MFKNLSTFPMNRSFLIAVQEAYISVCYEMIFLHMGD
jgi:hypothetical protein